MRAKTAVQFYSENDEWGRITEAGKWEPPPGSDEPASYKIVADIYELTTP